MVLRSSTKSTASMSAIASVTTWASLFTLSRLKRTCKSSKHSFVFLGKFRFHLAEHFLIVGASLLHLFGVGLEDYADLVVDAVLERQFIQQRGVDFFVETRHGFGFNQ